MILFQHHILLLLILSTTFWVPCFSRSLRHKRGIMKMMMHVMWDPVRLIRYWYAYDVTKEIAKSWRKIIPTMMVLPLHPDASITPGIAKYVHPTYGLKETNRVHPATHEYQYSNEPYSTLILDPVKQSMVAIPVAYQQFLRADLRDKYPSIHTNSKDVKNIPVVNWQGNDDGASGNQPDEFSLGRHQIVVPLEGQIPNRNNDAGNKVVFPSTLHTKYHGHKNVETDQGHQVYQRHPIHQGTDQGHQKHPINQETDQGHSAYQRYPINQETDQSHQVYLRHPINKETDQTQQVYLRHPIHGTNLDFSRLLSQAVQDDGREIHIVLHPVPISDSQSDHQQKQTISNKTSNDLKEYHPLLQNVPFSFAQKTSAFKLDNSETNCTSNCSKNTPQNETYEHSSVGEGSSDSPNNSNLGVTWVLQNNAVISNHSDHIAEDSNIKSFSLSDANKALHEQSILSDFSINMVQLKEALRHGTPVLLPFNNKKTSYSLNEEQNQDKAGKFSFSKLISSTESDSPSTSSQKLILFMANKTPT